MPIGDTIRNSQVWRSIFRHPAPVDRRNRVVVMLTDAELREVRRRSGETPLGTWLHELLVRVLRRPRT